MTSECPDLHSEELYSEWLAELKSELAKAGLDVDEAIESAFEFRAAYEDSQKPSETVRDYVMYCAEWFNVGPVWRPIESAPRDGTWILISDDKCWPPDLVQWRPSRKERVAGGYKHLTVPQGWFCSPGGRSRFDVPVGHLMCATRWVAIPEPAK